MTEPELNLKQPGIEKKYCRACHHLVVIKCLVRLFPQTPGGQLEPILNQNHQTQKGARSRHYHSYLEQTKRGQRMVG